jgi:hypothetical protein
MIAEQRATVGLAKGSKGQLSGRDSSGGSKSDPPERTVPTLADAGIDKHLADTARKLAKASDDEYRALETAIVEDIKQAVDVRIRAPVVGDVVHEG